MSVITGFAIYFIVWWITLFIVLPFGVHRDRNVEQGNDPGAPLQHRMLLKIILNSILALIIWLVIYMVDTYNLITLRELTGSIISLNLFSV